VLFLDEPTASLDPSATREIESVIKAFDAAGTKVVMATHNWPGAALGDEILFLDQGRLVERAPVGQFFSKPQSAQAPHSSKENCLDVIRRLLLLALLAALPAVAQEKFIVVASTTSTEQSGLFGYSCRSSRKRPGYRCACRPWHGQALDLARRGDADVVFVHARSAEEKFLAEGHGVERFDVNVQRLRPDRAEIGPAKVSGAATFSAP